MTKTIDACAAWSAGDLDADRRWLFALDDQARDDMLAPGMLFSKWNRNRVTSAQNLDGVPRLSAAHREALETFDAMVRRPDLAHTMWLEPGDVQIINSHVTVHSRTDFVDHDDAARKRLLFRLWLAPPDSEELPESWRVLYKAIAPGTVRGGIIGQHHDERCKAFEARQAADLGMRTAER